MRIPVPLKTIPSGLEGMTPQFVTDLATAIMNRIDASPGAQSFLFQFHALSLSDILLSIDIVALPSRLLEDGPDENLSFLRLTQPGRWVVFRVSLNPGSMVAIAHEICCINHRVVMEAAQKFKPETLFVCSFLRSPDGVKLTCRVNAVSVEWPPGYCHGEHLQGFLFPPEWTQSGDGSFHRPCYRSVPVGGVKPIIQEEVVLG